jgi:hypothetical protein
VGAVRPRPESAWPGAAAVSAGATAEVAAVEAIVPRWLRGDGPKPQTAVVVNVDSGSARAARRALRALRAEPVSLVSVDRVHGPELQAAFAGATPWTSGCRPPSPSRSTASPPG